MKIGVLKEIKNHEYRVGLIPGNVRELVARGHQVLVETKAGEGASFSDEQYRLAGADIAQNADEIFANCDMIVKVKEPQVEECKRLRTGQILFAYLHLAANPGLAELLLASGCIAIAYETVTDEQGALLLLAPMSDIAGRLSIQAGAHCLEKNKGGRGVLLSGVPGVTPAKVVVLGGGVAGTQAIRMARGLGANVFVLDKALKRLRELELIFAGQVSTCYSRSDDIERHLQDADLVIGTVLVPGASTPKIVSRAMVANMRPGSVVVDVSIDQGGCFETSKPTTHSEPTYVEEGVVHYCVTNMPAAVPRTATLALNNVTLPFILALADNGYKDACKKDHHLLQGLNICEGKVTHETVAYALKLSYTPPLTLL